jgi:hypothetical protein
VFKERKLMAEEFGKDVNVLRKFSRLICFSLALMMTLEAPAKATSPMGAGVHKAFHQDFKLLEMKTVGEVLSAAKPTKNLLLARRMKNSRHLKSMTTS